MSAYYKAKIVVGLPVRELLGGIGKDMEWVHEGGLEELHPDLRIFTTYYDGGDDQNNIAGLEVASTEDYSNAEISLFELDKQAAAKLHKFNMVTGLKGRVYLTTVGY